MTEQRTSEQRVDNPWREMIEGTIEGKTYFGVSDWYELLRDLDRLYKDGGEPNPQQSASGGVDPPSASLTSNPVRDAFYAGWKAAMDADECYIDTADKAWQCYSKADVASGTPDKDDDETPAQARREYWKSYDP